MYYFVLTDPNKSKVSLSLYFTSYKEALEYAKSVEKYNPKIITYDTTTDHTLMYDNLIHLL